jgi:TRAP-type uncharacterized transport system fused permease subunit
MVLLTIFLVLVALICINVPIAVALAVAGVVGLLMTEGPGSLVTVALDMYDGSTKFSLIAIPMFVLAGAIMNASGITKRLINFISALIGFVRGGLAMVNIGVSLFFAEISGSAVADVAAMGSIMIPEMKKRGYSAPFAAAVTSSSASLAVIIPPSIPMILYAASAETSVEQLFVAGFVPGFIGGLGLMLVAYVFARRYNFPVEEAFNLKRVRETFIEALPTFALPVIILGGIFGGIVTATEAAGLAVSRLHRHRHVVSRDQPQRALQRHARWRHADRRGDGAGGRVRGGRRLSDPRPGASGNCQPDPVDDRQQVRDPADPQHLLPDHRLLPALGCRHHPGGADRGAADRAGRHRSGALRPGGHAQPGHRPADAAGGLVLITACSIARANIWDVTRVNIWFIAVLLTVLLMCTYIPAIPMFLVEYFYRS